MLEGLRKPTKLIVSVLTLLAYGCPIQAIVHAFRLDESTVASWRDRAGRHCQQVHQAHAEEAGRGSDTENDAGNPGTRKRALASVLGRQRAQYRLY